MVSPDANSRSPLERFLDQQRRMFECGSCGDDAAGVLLPPPPTVPRAGEQAWHALSAPERAGLESFFRPLIEGFHAGYVLFGSKPMSLGAVITEEVKTTLVGTSRVTELDYATWARLAPRLPEGPFHIHLFNQLIPGGAADLIVLHRERLNAVVALEHDRFAAAFGPAINGPRMIERLTTAPTLRAALTDNEGRYREDLLGLMLGFPRQSVLAFQELQESRFTGAGAFASAPESNLNSSILPVRFRVHAEDQEARGVAARYDQERRRIDTLMRQTEWLRELLQALCPVEASHHPRFPG